MSGVGAPEQQQNLGLFYIVALCFYLPLLVLYNSVKYFPSGLLKLSLSVLFAVGGYHSCSHFIEICDFHNGGFVWAYVNTPVYEGPSSALQFPVRVTSQEMGNVEL